MMEWKFQKNIGWYYKLALLFHVLNVITLVLSGIYFIYSLANYEHS